MGKYFGMKIHARDALARRADEIPECAYCYNLVTTLEVPSGADDEMWELLAEEHAPECEWIATRAHVA